MDKRESTMFFTGDPKMKKKVDLGGRSNKERERQKLLQQAKLEREQRHRWRLQTQSATRIQVCVCVCIRFPPIDWLIHWRNCRVFDSAS